MARRSGMTKRSRRYRRQARLEAHVKYSPEQSALRGLLRDARDELRYGVRADRGAARLIQRTARSARPRVRKDYGRSIRSVKRQDAALKTTLRNLGPEAAPFLAAIAREGTGTRGRLQESRASSLAELEGRRADAAAGLAAAIRQRSAEFSKTRRSVHARQLDIARERGAFTAATIGDMAEADRKLDVQIQSSKRTARTSRANSRRTLRASRERLRETRRHNRRQESLAERKERRMRREGGRSRNKPSQSALNFRGDIEDIKSLIVDGEQAGGKSWQIRQGLKSGNNPSGKKYGATAINAAYDLHVHGYLSRPNIAALRRRGVPVPRSWRRGGSRRRGRGAYSGARARGRAATR